MSIRKRKNRYNKRAGNKSSRTSWYYNKRKKGRFSIILWLLKWLSIMLIWVGAAIFILLIYYAIDLPDVEKLYGHKRSPGIKIIAGNGEVLGNYGHFYSDYVPYHEFPQELIDAVVATEDRRFFSHFGIDVRGLLRAMYVNIREGKIVQGGSTITQQLAKIMFLTPERNLKRKAREFLLALNLESEFTKEEILAFYLNNIYLGAGNYGVQSAARNYFDKDVAELNLFESAMIAGLIRAPSRYSPAHNPELAVARANQVIQNMMDNNMLHENFIIERDINIKTAYNKKGNLQQSSKYFLDWIIDQIPDYVGQIEEDIIVTTTLDPKLQELAEESLVTEIVINGSDKDVNQGAMVVMDTNGAIKAMIGGRNYQQSQFNRATQALRQPGSAFKLFVYLTAFNKDISPDMEIVDAPLLVDNWQPKNYNDNYVGEISLRNAFSKSINTVAVRLAKEVGMSSVIQTAKNLGITTKINNNLSSALGTSEVVLLELTGAYAHLANNGNAVWQHGIEKIATLEGETLYERNNDSGQIAVLPAQSVAFMNDLLLNAVRDGTGRAANINGRDVAGKTGTSQDFRDAWFIGFSGKLVAGVWVGNDDNLPMQHIAGGNIPARVFNNFMRQAVKEDEETTIPVTVYAVNRARKGDYKEDTGSFWQSIFGFGKDKKEKEGLRIEYEYPD